MRIPGSNELGDEGFKEMTLGFDINPAPINISADTLFVLAAMTFKWDTALMQRWIESISPRWSDSIGSRWVATFKGRDPR